MCVCVCACVTFFCNTAKSQDHLQGHLFICLSSQLTQTLLSSPWFKYTDIYSFPPFLLGFFFAYDLPKGHKTTKTIVTSAGWGRFQGGAL